MSWFAIAKFVAPLAVLLGVYLYAHDAGWKERDATVLQEKQDAALAAANAVSEKCAKDKALTNEVSYEYQEKIKAANDRLAAALGSLYDVRHNKSGGTTARDAAGRRDDGAADNRLYYPNERAAASALERAAVATRQAEQLIACQGFIKRERE